MEVSDFAYSNHAVPFESGKANPVNGGSGDSNLSPIGNRTIGPTLLAVAVRLIANTNISGRVVFSIGLAP